MVLAVIIEGTTSYGGWSGTLTWDSETGFSIDPSDDPHMLPFLHGDVIAVDDGHGRRPIHQDTEPIAYMKNLCKELHSGYVRAYPAEVIEP